MVDISEVCGLVRNYFIRNKNDVKNGVFTIKDGMLSPSSFIKNGQYFRVIGSTFNDGVWKMGEAMLTDEVFEGQVWAMSPPPAFLQLVDEISRWQTENAKVLDSPYSSESFGGYSYSKSAGSDGAAYGWQDAFASKLKIWRKVNTI